MRLRHIYFDILIYRFSCEKHKHKTCFLFTQIWKNLSKYNHWNLYCPKIFTSYPFQPQLIPVRSTPHTCTWSALRPHRQTYTELQVNISQPISLINWPCHLYQNQFQFLAKSSKSLSCQKLIMLCKHFNRNLPFLIELCLLNI